MTLVKKVLCFHGGSSNKDMFKEWLLPIINQCPQYEFVFFNAPVTREKPNSYYWFNKDGYKVTVNAVNEIWDDSFVGVMGMSWGSVATMLTVPYLNPQPQWAVTFISTFPQVAFKEDLAKVQFNGSFFNIVGEKDVGENLLKGFDGEYTSHPGGHIIPTDEPSIKKVVDFINRQ